MDDHSLWHLIVLHIKRKGTLSGIVVYDIERSQKRLAKFRVASQTPVQYVNMITLYQTVKEVHRHVRVIGRFGETDEETSKKKELGRL